MRTVSLLILLAAPCHAQWSATILHPTGAVESVGRGSAMGLQAGEYTSAGKHAAIWAGSAGSLLDLHPSPVDYPGAGASVIYAAAGTQQAGVVTYGFTDHAAIWSGTSASYIDLNPPSISASRIFGTDGGNQAGVIDVGVSHAAVWAGTPVYVDLHPPTAVASTAQDVQGLNIAGYSVYSASVHASCWSTSLHIHTDLHPVGYDNSFGTSVSSTQQGGQVTLGGTNHAGLWTGTAASFIDLNPAGYSGSNLLGMDEGIQCGWAFKLGSRHAGVWFGVAGSFVDLGDLLPAGYTNSEARAVWTDGTTMQVVGFADHITDTGTRLEAIVWTTVVPEPALILPFVALTFGLFRKRMINA